MSRAAGKILNGSCRYGLLAVALCFPSISFSQGALTPDPTTGRIIATPGQAVPGASQSEIRRTEQAPLANAEGELPEVSTESSTDALTADAQLSFVLRGAEITGSTVYGEGDFEPIISDFVDKEISLGGLREIGNRIERKYRDAGYVATRVIIPPQAIRGGVPKLEVFEGKIIHYEINGEIGPVKKQIASLLDNLLTDEPARWSDLERYLLLSRDLPGVSLTGTLRPAGDSSPGGVILVVDTARKPVDAFINVQNRNADPTGPWTVSGGVSLNSNTEYAERLGIVGLAAVEPLEQLSGFLSYEQSLGNDGLRFKASLNQGQSEPRNILLPLRLSTVTTVARVELEYPVIRSRTLSVWTRGGFEIADQTTSARGAPLFDDQLRMFYAGARGVWFQQTGGATEFDFEVKQGLTHFGAPDFFSTAQLRSRTDARSDLTLVRGKLSHRQRIPPFFEVYGEARGQYASKPLPSIEEMSLGELSIGRGFEPGALTGDSGFGFALELRFTPPAVEAWWLNDLELYGFFDYGRIHDRGNPTQNPRGYEDLASSGFGARFQVFEKLFGDVYLAIPRTRALSTATRILDPTVKFSLTAFF